nr:host-nuclease inhibitor Gam family protein [Levilactobacillus brevis]
MDALEKYDLENDEVVSKPKFEITDLSSATWAMRKYRALAAKDDELKKVALEQKESIDTWLESKLQANQDSRAFFEGLFADYLTKLRQMTQRHESRHRSVRFQHVKRQLVLIGQMRQLCSHWKNKV